MLIIRGSCFHSTDIIYSLKSSKKNSPRESCCLYSDYNNILVSNKIYFIYRLPLSWIATKDWSFAFLLSVTYCFDFKGKKKPSVL